MSAYSVIIVCGGRHYSDAKTVYRVLDHIVESQAPDRTIIVQGGATGADTLAARYAAERGLHCAEVPARWATHGASAGPLRNAAMLALNPTMVVAFPGGRGTANMCKQAEASNIPVLTAADLLKLMGGGT